MIDSVQFEWLSQDQWLAMGVAGCVTLVSGSTSQSALVAFGGEAEAAVVPVGSVAAQAAPNLAGVCDLAGGGVLVVEPNGFQGARHEVLRRVSKQGAAAVVQWGLNGSVYFGCARKGRVICLVDLLLDDELAGVPAKLKLLVPHERVEADLVAVGAAMAATFVSVEFTEGELAAVETLHVLSPVLADLALIPPSLSISRDQLRNDEEPWFQLQGRVAAVWLLKLRRSGGALAELDDVVSVEHPNSDTDWYLVEVDGEVLTA